MDKKSYTTWLEFLEKGLHANSSSFLKFAVLWLSFAGYLNQTYAEEWKEHNKLERFRQDNEEFYKELIKDPEFTRLLSEFSYTSTPPREFVMNLQDRRPEKNDYFKPEDQSDFNKYIEVIYQIRCNFFHGDKIPFDSNDEKLVLWAYKSFLYFWKTYLNTH